MKIKRSLILKKNVYYFKKNTEDKNNKNKNQTINFEKYLINVQIQLTTFFFKFLL